MSSTGTLRRSTTDVKLAGLCSALARRWNVDPVLVRVGWALLALSGGVGLVLYLAGWLLIPIEGSDSAPIEDVAGDVVQRWPKELWITLVVVACIAVFAAFSAILPFSVGPAIVIAVIWYFGFYKPRSNEPPRTPPPPAAVAPPMPTVPQFARYPGPQTPFTEAAEAWQRRIAEHYETVAAARLAQPTPNEEWPVPPFAPVAPVAAAQSPNPQRDPSAVEHDAFLTMPDPVGLYAEPEASEVAQPVRAAHRRSARRLRLVTLGVLGLTLSGLGIADYAGQSVPVIAYAGAALLVIGLALIAATRFGRARGLLPVGVLLLVTVLGLSMSGSTETGLPTPPTPGTTRSYTSVSQLPPAGDVLDVGRLTVDLSRLQIASDTTYSARVDGGELEVIVPSDVKVVVDYRVDFGQITAYGKQVAQGPELVGVIPDPLTRPPSSPTLTLELAVDVGQITVRR